jgi:hypothetical protein
MANHIYSFEVGTKIGRNISYFPDHLGSKRLQSFSFHFHNAMWYDPRKYSHSDGRANSLFGLLYRGGLFTSGAESFYWGWKPSFAIGEFEIYANIRIDVALPPNSHMMARVKSRERLLMTFTKTDYYGFDLRKYDAYNVPQPLAFWQRPNRSRSFWFAYRYPPMIEVPNGSPKKFFMAINEEVIS